jgi:hypothetical protein
MHSRRLTRLTNAFSGKVANHAHAMALHFTISFASSARRRSASALQLGADIPGIVLSHKTKPARG